MLNKEIKDTLILFFGSILVALATLGFTFLLIRLTVDKGFPFAETAPTTIYVLLMAMAFYLGISLFSREKNERTFEYLFSLKYSRGKILLFKLAPRVASLLGFLFIYFILSQAFTPFPVHGGWNFTLLLYFSFFLSSVPLSLLHRNHLANLIYGVIIYMIVFTVSFLVISHLRFFFLDTFSVIRIMMAVIFVISVLVSMAFGTKFSRADLGNVHSLSVRSLFGFLKVFGTPALILLIIWVVINRFDAPEIETGFIPDKNRMATEIDKNNGSYRLWTLSEAPEMDVESEKIVEKYRRLYGFRYFQKDQPRTWDQQSYQANYRPFLKKRNHILRKHNFDLEVFTRPEKDIVGEIIRARKAILRLSREYDILLSRYRKLLDCTAFVDITRPGFLNPLPNLVAWLHVSKLHDWVSVLKAVDGNWDQAAERLIDHIDFQKTVLKNTRLVLVNLICKSNMQYSLYTLAGLMNRKACPESVCQTVLNRLPPRSILELGTRKALEADYLGWAGFIDQKEYLDDRNGLLKWVSSLFLQENRTKRYFYRPYKEIIGLESQPPFQWETGLEKFEKKYRNSQKKGFWWIQNPVGKWIAGYTAPRYLVAMIHRTVMLKSLTDMIRISAELHLEYDPGKTVEENLKKLNGYKALDPCSGKPYRWNAEKQVLYSLGVDRDDDGGVYRYNQFLDSDYILPVILHPR